MINRLINLLENRNIRNSHVLRLVGIKFWLTLASLGFLFYAVVVNSRRLFELSLSGFVLSWLLLGIIISLTSIIVNAIAWKLLLKWLGYEANNINIVSLFLTSNLLKYLPGGIWHFFERLRVLQLQMPFGRSLASVVLEPILMSISALLLVPLGGWQSGLSVLCIMPSLLLVPRFREPLLKRLEIIKVGQLNRAKAILPASGELDDLGSGRDDYPLKVLVIEMLFVFLRFGGFWCCLNAFLISSSLETGLWIAIFAFAWTVGLVVPAAPGGLGIFEATVLLRIHGLVEEPQVIAALLSYRILVTIADLIAALLARDQKNFQGDYLRGIFRKIRINRLLGFF